MTQINYAQALSDGTELHKNQMKKKRVKLTDEQVEFLEARF